MAKDGAMPDTVSGTATKGRILYDLEKGSDNLHGYSSCDLKKNTTVYRYTGITYGCISDGGIAVTDSSEGKNPFYEIPENAVEWEQ